MEASIMFLLTILFMIDLHAQDLQVDISMEKETFLIQ